VSRPKVRIKVPASTANLGPGFDSLGMALNLYIWMEIGVADKTRIHLIGEGMEDIPTDKSNLIYEIAQRVFQQAGKSHPELEITMYSEIPLARGLGSSASAIVGALSGANAIIGDYFSKEELFRMACLIEKHPDNVAASLFGGIAVACWDGIQADYVRIDPHPQLEVLVAIPNFKLLTEDARKVLPQQVTMRDAVYNLSHASMLVAALSTGRLDMIKDAMKDAIHQPYRATLIPGMATILQEAVEHGALGVALSGAGPTMIALVDQQHTNKQRLEMFMQKAFHDQGIEVHMLWLQPEHEGVQIMHTHPEDMDFTLYIEGKA
jgi:homoserine kinase